MANAKRSKIGGALSRHKGAVAATATAVLAAAAATALLAGKKNAPRRKKLATWATGVKREVVKELKQAKQFNKQAYLKAVSKVTGRYKKFKNVDTKQLAALGANLKKHWTVVSKELDAARKDARGYAKRIKR
jgi:hypothetical protein